MAAAAITKRITRRWHRLCDNLAARWRDPACAHRGDPRHFTGTFNRAWPVPSSGPPLRVLLEVADFCAGGLERVVLDLAHVLRAAGHEPLLLITGQRGAAAENAAQAGLRIHTLHPPTAWPHAYRELLRSERIDIVNAHASLYGAPHAAAAAIPFVQTVHNTLVWFEPREVYAYRAADSHTSAYVCVSDAVAADFAARCGIQPDKLATIPNGIDTTAFHTRRAAHDRTAVRQALGLRPAHLLILNVAALAGSKGQLFLVRAFARARRERDDLRLILVGGAAEPDYAAFVANEAARQGVAPVVMLTGYAHDPTRYFAAADVFALPSLCEGWSLALTEAACAGLPLVASDVGGARPLCERFGGHLVPPPFLHTCALSAAGFVRLAHRPLPDYEAALASALLQAAERPILRPTDESQRTLDRSSAFAPYLALFALLRARHTALPPRLTTPVA
ncbi:MAG: glycosyltransferase family 4 protein [Phycisphaerales bacterium]|nr:glycosyltransferase family 4 protein [Phycisphaerales bacterium]